MSSTTSRKGPAEAATSPDQGPNNLRQENQMNTQVNITAEAGTTRGTPRLDYIDLESCLLTAENMAEIACDKIESAQGKFNKTARGYHLSDAEMNLISFAIYHTSDLIKALKERWIEVHKANGGNGREVSS